MELPLVPSQLSPEERRQARELREEAKFSIDHYMADFIEDEMIQPILAFPLSWVTSMDTYAASKYPEGVTVLSVTGDSSSVFTDPEKEQLRKLPHKEYLLDPSEQQVAMLDLLDILLAFTYDLRSTLGEHTVESGWTISKISSVLSSADVSVLPSEI